MADNREEWVTTFLAACALDWTISPFYEVKSFGSAQIMNSLDYILTKTEL
jgi:hypothetical protein